MVRLLSAPAQKLFYGFIFYICHTAASYAGDISLSFIGQQIIPHDYQYQDTIVGGLSALDYDPKTNRFVAVCDDRSKYNPARFYGLALKYDTHGFHQWDLTDVQFLKQPDGSNFPKPRFLGKTSVDPEALKFSPAHNSYFWTSEGHAKHGVNPFIREMDLQGNYLRDFTLPEKYMVDEDGNKGVRDNLVFEAMTINGDQSTITVSTEGPLIQDGAEANVKHGAPVRFLHLDIKSGQPTHEYVYMVEPVHKETLPFGNFSINGVVDILSLPDNRYIVVERSFSTGAGLSVKLYLADFTEATDVLARETLKESPYRPAKKQLLFDLGELGIVIDNIEGLSFGKILEDGRRSLILISDNNFRSAQVTQILAFAVDDLRP